MERVGLDNEGGTGILLGWGVTAVVPDSPLLCDNAMDMTGTQQLWT